MKKLIHITLVFILLSMACKRVNKSELGNGFLNLKFNYVMSTYTTVKDTQCGCTTEGVSVFAHYSPQVSITDDKGQLVFNEYSRQVNLENYPLREGKYSIRYSAKVFDFYPCDTARDIWQARRSDGSVVLCVNKKAAHYTSFDSTEYFEIRRTQTTELKRNF